ncbi:MAG: efflux RND transporter permease subunit [Cyclobacteriaceae bacterium]
MLNRIIDASLKNRWVVLFLALVISVAGSIIALEMDVDVFPDLTAPTVTVLTEAHGMATEEVERLVTYQIESALNGAPNVRRIRSSSAMGISIVWAEIEWGTEIYRARQIVSEKLTQVGENLPPGIGSPVLAPVSSIMGEIMLISVMSDSISPMELRTLSDWNIRKRLLSVGGVSQVIVIGGDYKQYQVLASPERLKYYGITFAELEEAVAGANENASGGFLNQYGNQYIIRGEGKTTALEELGQAVVKVVDQTPITIADVARLAIGSAPKIGDGAMRGEEAVILTVLKQPETNTLELTERIDEALADIQNQLPPGVAINTHIFRQANFIQASIDNLQRTLMEGAFFVTLVLFLFLLNYRTTLISLLAIPLSLFVTIIVLELLGLTINTMSLGGMAIAIGVLVDDAIIDMKNIYKRLRENARKPEAERESVIRAVYLASKEIRNSIMIATLIIIIAFIPLFFLSGMEGRLLRPLGIAFITAVITSLLVAVTLTPVLSSYLLGNHERLLKQSEGSAVERWLSRRYRWVLERVLKRPKAIIAATIALFAITVLMMTGLGRSFLPEFNEGSLVVSVVTPPGISLEESDKTGTLVEQILLSMPEIEVTSRRTGRAERDEHAQGVNASEVDAPFVLQDRSEEAFLADLRNQLSVVPGANITIGQPIAHRIDHMLSGTRANIAIKIFGPELSRLFSLGNQIQRQIQEVEGLVDLNVEQQIEVPQLRIKPKRALLAKYGIRMQDLMNFVDGAFAGETVSQVYEGQQNFDLVLRYEEDDRDNLESIRQAPMDTYDGSKIPLYYVADVSVTGSPYNVNREDVQRKVVVSANVSGRDLRGVVNEIQQRIATGVDIPQEYRLEYGGQFESEANASRLLLLASIAAIVIIFLLLYLEFKDLTLSGIVLLNLPLALIGGVIIVFFTSGIVSIASTIGFISLFGIATRNGILLISHYQSLLLEGKSLHDTLVLGSLDRLNPILMTAFTTGLALIPLALSGGEAGNEIQSPMAVVILGGLLSATLLNLAVIPAVFFLLYRKKYQ